MDQWYAVVDGAGNLVSTGTVVADDAHLAANGLSKVALSGPPGDGMWSAAARSFVAPPVPLTVLSKLAFIQRFTYLEFAAIRKSADDQVQYLLYQIDHAETVTPQDATVQAGLGYLVHVGILTADRAAVIGAN